MNLEATMYVHATNKNCCTKQLCHMKQYDQFANFIVEHFKYKKKTVHINGFTQHFSLPSLCRREYCTNAFRPNFVVRGILLIRHIALQSGRILHTHFDSFQLQRKFSCNFYRWIFLFNHCFTTVLHACLFSCHAS